MDYPFDPRDYDTRIPPFDLGVRVTGGRDDRFRDEEFYNHIASSSRSSLLYNNPTSPVPPALYPRVHPDTGARLTHPENRPHLADRGSSVLDPSLAPVPSRPVLEYRQYQPHQRVTGLSEPAELSLMDCTFQPNTPPPKLPDLSFGRLDLHPPGLTHPLPEPLPRSKVLSVVNPDPAPIAVSKQSEDALMNPGMQKFNQPEDKNESERNRKALRMKWCHPHFAYDNCDADDLAKARARGAWVPPSPSPSPSQGHPKDVPSSKSNMSSTYQTSSMHNIAVPVHDTEQNKVSKTAPGTGCTDPNRFLDFAARQRASQALHTQSCAQLRDAAIRKLNQKKMRDQILDEAKMAKTKWQSGVDKASTDLIDIAKKMQASSRLPLRGKTIAPQSVPKKEAVGGFPVQYPGDYFTTQTEKLNISDTAKDEVTSKSAVTVYIEQAAAKYRDDLGSGAEPKKMNFSHDPMGSCLTAEQEAGVNGEKTTSRTRIIAARTKALAAEADADAKWDNVDFSDDEDWEKVVSDEEDDWEVLEK